MTQFEIWFANLPAVAGSIQSGMRPVVIVSNNAANKFSPVITAVPLTSNLRKTALPTHVLLCESGLNISKSLRPASSMILAGSFLFDMLKCLT